ncbi:pilus assembly protein [Pontibacterium granulatum]|uniref:TadE/TadG family type IV pilus assembly protein n=1 Tax=Pontibacterium granulatum TaxID=2036029 RepID=UPI00249CE669|nr:TadE family protein [Pontibacterium granulatum]MDI3323798.1 pilus assembly protein [Pontibacterium granulatum]
MPTNKNKQRGATSVEFAIIGVVFFMVLFAVIEFGRLMFVMETLDEITRRGARLAAVCPVDAASVSFVQNQAMFNGGVVAGLEAEMINVTFWEQDGTEVIPDPADPESAIPLIDYVRVGIDNFQHQMLIPTLNFTIPMPDFNTTIPSESLGVHPDGSSASCS